MTHSTLDCEHYDAPTGMWRLCDDHEDDLAREFVSYSSVTSARKLTSEESVNNSR